MPGAATQLSVVGGAAPPSAPAAGDPASARRPVITIRGLSKSFNDTVIYDKFDLDLPQGEAERLWQEHADQHDIRPDTGRCRSGPVRRPDHPGDPAVLRVP